MTSNKDTIQSRTKALTFTILILVLLMFAGIASAGIPTKDPGTGSNAAPVAPSPTPAECILGWDFHSTNVVTTTSTELFRGDAIGPTDVWAVGADDSNGLIEHWDGNSWHVLTATAVLSNAIYYDVAALQPNDVWVVGRGGPYYPNPDHSQPYIIHWDGFSWNDFALPITLDDAALYSIDATSPTDIWAVGGYYSGGELLVYHWDGTSWTVVPAPLPGASIGLLYSVDALSSDDVWATGWMNGASLTIHWDGTSWAVISSPYDVILYSVSALSTNDVWAVGYNNSEQSKILHWDGTAWAISYDGGVRYRDIHAFAPNDVLVAGDGIANPTSLLHWDGVAWSPLGSPQQTSSGGIFDIVPISSTDMWFVGTLIAFNPNRGQALAMHYGPWCPTPIACRTGWNDIDHPRPDPVANLFTAIDGVAPNDLWAVGVAAMSVQIQHWNGSYWSISPAQFQPTPVMLADVAAVSSDDVWVAGYNYSYSNRPPGQLPPELDKPDSSPAETTYTSVIMHWDGTSWSSVPTPNLNSLLNHLSVVSANNIWAVGSYYPAANVQRVLILHWNGSTWSIASPGDIDGGLLSIDAISANDVWAVGNTSSGINAFPLIMHWDGTQWSTVTNPGVADSTLYDVTALDSNDVWAVGNSAGNSPLALHWSGSAWSTVSVPGAGALASVSAVSPVEVWALGTVNNTTRNQQILRWDGSTWQIITDGPPYYDRSDILALSSNEIWYVGGYYTGYRFESVVGRYMGSCLTPTPTPMPTSTPTSTPTTAPTQTPGGPTATTAPTNTNTPVVPSTTSTATTIPSATSTTCTIQFADIPLDHTFYPYIRCLACQGIISGYPCGVAGEPCNATSDPYFRPNNGVTRGQLAKIVSEASGFNDTHTGQTFEDVPEGSTFYLYVERLASRGVMQGYPCGGAGEPCGQGNHQYFRPNAGATRGQIAKIVSNAMQWSDSIPAGQYTFTDAPEGSTFHPYIERLLMHRPGAMQGYPCGSSSEPCDAQSRAYFRPSNTLTRGQTSKIVSNAILLACLP